MRPKRKKVDREKMAQILSDAKKRNETREQGYRERALALFPNVCGRCGRTFFGKDLRELTVHHKDHDHDNNPPDGSNWELLCVYCHDDEHQDAAERDTPSRISREIHTESSLGHNPFAGLSDLVIEDEDETSD